MEVLWEKIQFWKKSKKIPEYQFLNHDDTTWVKITSGTYAGVIYSYGMVRLTSEIGYPKLEFSYNIIHPSKYDYEDLRNDSEFVIIMGDILTEIIIKNESVRKEHSEKLDLQ